MARRVKQNEAKMTVKLRLTGEATRGKSTFAIAMANDLLAKNGNRGDVYLWLTDGRDHEYINGIGAQHILMPEANPMDPGAVLAEIQADMRDRSQPLKNVVCVIMDNLTNIFTERTALNQRKTFDGQGTAGASDKANAMRVVQQAIARFTDVPAVTISHTYLASKDGRSKANTARDSISDLELSRMRRSFNAELEAVYDSRADKYGIMIRYNRDRPGMAQPITLWDEVGEHRGMYARILAALGDGPAIDEPMTWEEFDAEHPFPSPDVAIHLGAHYCVEHNGIQFHAFGDPTEQATKQDGSPGTNGALNYARNTYEKVRSGREDGKKANSAEEMTVKWKQAIERRIAEKIEAYEHIQAEAEVEGVT